VTARHEQLVLKLAEAYEGYTSFFPVFIEVVLIEVDSFTSMRQESGEIDCKGLEYAIHVAPTQGPLGECPRD
jgi:hypothetical protein